MFCLFYMYYLLSILGQLSHPTTISISDEVHIYIHFLMVSTLVGDVGVFSINLFVTNFTTVRHVKMFAMGTFYVVLYGVKFVATFATNQTYVALSNIPPYKVLKLLISFYKRNKQ